MIDDLPQERIRTMGAATDSYLTGEFKVAGKPAYLLIYTKSHPILKIETREKFIIILRVRVKKRLRFIRKSKQNFHNKTEPTHDGRPCFCYSLTTLNFVSANVVFSSSWLTSRSAVTMAV